MRKPESIFWSRIKHLFEGLDPIRIEAETPLGVPDVNYKDGWVELKYVKEWPKRESTPLRLRHFTPEQRSFLSQREKSGGHAFLLLGVGEQVLLFGGKLAGLYVGKYPRVLLHEIALRTWDSVREINIEEFQRCL